MIILVTEQVEDTCEEDCVEDSDGESISLEDGFEVYYPSPFHPYPAIATYLQPRNSDKMIKMILNVFYFVLIFNQFPLSLLGPEPHIMLDNIGCILFGTSPWLVSFCIC